MKFIDGEKLEGKNWNYKKTIWNNGEEDQPRLNPSKWITFTVTCCRQYDFRYDEKIRLNAFAVELLIKLFNLAYVHTLNNAVSSSLPNVSERKLDSLLFYQEQQSGVDAVHSRIGLDKLD